jgi:hypothetical protein
MDLPIRLMVVFLLLSISVPMIANAMEQSERDTKGTAMEHEIGRLYDSVITVYYSGTGSSKNISITIPNGCEMYIGGDGVDSYSIRSSFKGSSGPTRYMERPNVELLCNITLYEGTHDISLLSVMNNGKIAVEITVI